MLNCYAPEYGMGEVQKQYLILNLLQNKRTQKINFKMSQDNYCYRCGKTNYIGSVKEMKSKFVYFFFFFFSYYKGNWMSDGKKK